MFQKHYWIKYRYALLFQVKFQLDPNKVNVLWQKNSWDQPNLQEFFGNKAQDTKSMIGMYSIVIGTMKNLDTSLIYQLSDL
jgi:hypothetical protein